MHQLLNVAEADGPCKYLSIKLYANNEHRFSMKPYFNNSLVFDTRTGHGAGRFNSIKTVKKEKKRRQNPPKKQVNGLFVYSYYLKDVFSFSLTDALTLRNL